jgi:hypothetical protein
MALEQLLTLVEAETASCAVCWSFLFSSGSAFFEFVSYVDEGMQGCSSHSIIYQLPNPIGVFSRCKKSHDFQSCKRSDKKRL